MSATRPTAPLGRLMAALTAVLAIVYPVLVYIGLTRWDSRLVALLILGFVALSVLTKLGDPDKRARLRSILVIPAAIITLAGLSAALDSPTLLLITPVLISLALLFTFGVSLRAGATPMIENFARLQEPDLSRDELAWCRQITVLWCGFFVVNGALALVLALAAPMAWWAVYTGGIAYVLMGVLFAGELVFRKWKFQKFDSGVIDRVLVRFLATDQTRQTQQAQEEPS